MVEVVKRMRVEGNDTRGRNGCEKKEMVVRSCVEKILFIEVYVVCERGRPPYKSFSPYTVHTGKAKTGKAKAASFCLTEKSKQKTRG